jgi:hypothetical protein
MNSAVTDAVHVMWASGSRSPPRRLPHARRRRRPDRRAGRPARQAPRLAPRRAGRRSRSARWRPDQRRLCRAGGQGPHAPPSRWSCRRIPGRWWQTRHCRPSAPARAPPAVPQPPRALCCPRRSRPRSVPPARWTRPRPRSRRAGGDTRAGRRCIRRCPPPGAVLSGSSTVASLTAPLRRPAKPCLSAGPASVMFPPG